MSKKLNKSTENISISLPSWLIEVLDEIIEDKDFSRSSFCKRAIKKYLLYQIEDPILWGEIYKLKVEKSR